MEQDIIYKGGSPDFAQPMAWLVMQAMDYDCCHWFMGEGHALEEFHAMMARLICREDSLYSYRNATLAVAQSRAGAALAGVCISYPGSEVAALRRSFEAEMLQNFGKDYRHLPYETTSDEYYIDTLCVHSSFRRQGIATRLLRHAIAKAAPFHLPPTLLVDENNPSAERLYARLGFQTFQTDSWGGHNMKRMRLPATP